MRIITTKITLVAVVVTLVVIMMGVGVMMK